MKENPFFFIKIKLTTRPSELKSRQLVYSMQLKKIKLLIPEYGLNFIINFGKLLINRGNLNNLNQNQPKRIKSKIK